MPSIVTVRPSPEEVLDSALTALSAGADGRAVLDQLPYPVYTTDAEGLITYWNRACVDFAGREPQLGEDRWCVTWHLYTMEGEPLPHHECPMATAVREQRAVRDAIAIAERPDGSRVAFRPYPTPLFDAGGALAGAVNLLIDVTDEQNSALRDQAERCRRLAGATYDRRTSRILDDMAVSFDRTADGLGLARPA